MQFSDLNFTPCEKDARNCALFVIEKPFNLDQTKVDKIIKLIEKAYQKDKNMSLNYLILLQMQISLDAYGFRYDKDFLDSKAIENLNSIYKNLLDKDQKLNSERLSVYLFHLGLFKKNALHINEDLISKIVYYPVEEKSLD